MRRTSALHVPGTLTTGRPFEFSFLRPRHGVCHEITHPKNARFHCHCYCLPRVHRECDGGEPAPQRQGGGCAASLPSTGAVSRSSNSALTKLSFEGPAGTHF